MDQELSALAKWRRSRVWVPGAQPAAGADWTVTVPAGHVYQVLSVAATLTTSAVVANRVPRLIYSDGVADFLTVPPFAVVPASTGMRLSWFPLALGLSTGVAESTSIPEVTLLPGGSLRSSTGLIDPGDQWTAVVLQVLDTTERRGPVSLEEAAELSVVILSQPLG